MPFRPAGPVNPAGPVSTVFESDYVPAESTVSELGSGGPVRLRQARQATPVLPGLPALGPPDEIFSSLAASDPVRQRHTRQAPSNRPARHVLSRQAATCPPGPQQQARQARSLPAGDTSPVIPRRPDGSVLETAPRGPALPRGLCSFARAPKWGLVLPVQPAAITTPPVALRGAGIARADRMTFVRSQFRRSVR